MVEAAPACPSPPPSGSARHRSGGSCGSGCSCLAPCSPPPLPARSARPLLCQAGPFPLCRSFPFHPTLLKHFSLCSSFSSYPDRGGLELLARGPEAGGGDRLAAGSVAPHCLGQEAKATGLSGIPPPAAGKGLNGLVPDCPKVSHPESPHPLSPNSLLFPIQPQNNPNSGNALREVETFRVDNAKRKKYKNLKLSWWNSVVL